MTTLLILTENYPDRNFETIQSVVSDLVAGCELAESMMFTYANARDNNFPPATDEKSFDSLQRIVSVKDFMWPAPPKPHELGHSIMKMIETLDSSYLTPKNSNKYFLILSNFDLYVDRDDAKMIHDRLVQCNIHAEIGRLPTEKSDSSSSGEINDDDVPISDIDPVRTFRLENINDLHSSTKDMTHCTKLIQNNIASNGDDIDEKSQGKLSFCKVDHFKAIATSTRFAKIS